MRLECLAVLNKVHWRWPNWHLLTKEMQEARLEELRKHDFMTEEKVDETKTLLQKILHI